MVNDTSLPSQTKLNIDAAKKYVSTAEATIEDSAKIALQTLEKALSSSEETKEGLMALAQAVESAQTESAKEFTAGEFEKQITTPSVPQIAEGTPENNETLPPNATAEYIVEKVYETNNETLIDGAELLLSTLDTQLEVFSLSPYEKENIKIGILGYVFDHYYEVLGGIKISEIGSIFTDINNTFKKVGDVTKGGLGGVMKDPMGKFDAAKSLMEGSTDSFSKVSNFLDNKASIEERVSGHIAQKFGLMLEILGTHRPAGKNIDEADVLSGFLSDPQNIIDIEKKFPAKTAEEFEQQIKTAPQAGPERTAEMAGRLKRVFENKTAILDKVTGSGKHILDMFADSPDTGGPMSWGRDMLKGVLKFLSGLPFIGNFIKMFLGVEPSEDIDTYFGDEKRFQRLSAKNLKALSQSKKSPLMSGKNLVNVTTRRLAPFTKAYMPVSMTPEQKIPAVSPEMWSSIIDQHEIIVFEDKKQVKKTIPPTSHITESDFVNGKPQESFFKKINGLTDVLAGKTPPAPPSNTEQAPAETVLPASKNETPAPTPTPEPTEGKTKAEIAGVIVSKGKEMLSRAREGAKEIKDKATQKLLLSTLDNIESILREGNIGKLPEALTLLNTYKEKMPSEDQISLQTINNLISAWGRAPDTKPAASPIASTEKVAAKKDTPPTPTSPESDVDATFWSSAKAWWNTGVDGIKSYVAQKISSKPKQ
ncbi:MAG: hypothetical protein WC753_03970 [Candidatus Gracilibacteria bacterium]